MSKTPDYKAADAIRKQIEEKGYQLKDTPEGTYIRKKGSSSWQLVVPSKK